MPDMPGATTLRRTVIGIVALLASMLGAVVESPSAHALPSGLHYVALGDSRASGNMPGLQPSDGCWRSSTSYPSVLARIAHVRGFVDRSCAGAWAANVTHLPENGPFGPIPPQIRGVSKTTNLVTISIGGNDVNWGAIAERCQVPLPGGDARCRFNTGHIAAAHRMLVYMEGQVADVIRAVREKAAPNARIVLVGHGGQVGRRGCWPFVPASDGDAAWMNDFLAQVNAAQARIAARYGAAFVDVGARSAGHDPCSAQPWFEGAVPREVAVFGHPNQVGAAMIAEWIREID